MGKKCIDGNAFCVSLATVWYIPLLTLICWRRQVTGCRKAACQDCPSLSKILGTVEIVLSMHTDGCCNWPCYSLLHEAAPKMTLRTTPPNFFLLSKQFIPRLFLAMLVSFCQQKDTFVAEKIGFEHLLATPFKIVKLRPRKTQWLLFRSECGVA